MSSYVRIRNEVLEKLEVHLPEIRERFGIVTLGIFGSVSRGEDTENSDVDVLYLFEEGRGDLFEFIAFHEYLEELFGRKVDLVSVEYIDRHLKPYIQADALFFKTETASA
ncbi:MAG TPA: nucleotidyltransferase family protein [Methanocorpusculum sp.]|nr:nucleotidyltransferase family protein [Methanocorpusculum sp.]